MMLYTAFAFFMLFMHINKLLADWRWQVIPSIKFQLMRDELIFIHYPFQLLSTCHFLYNYCCLGHLFPSNQSSHCKYSNVMISFPFPSLSTPAIHVNMHSCSHEESLLMSLCHFIFLLHLASDRQ